MNTDLKYLLCMKIILLLISFVSFSAHALYFDNPMDFFQYPEDRPYTAADKGIRPYRALSLYNTSTFTLTFDDGPDLERTPKVLDSLKKFGIKATFFVLTSKVNDSTFPLIKRMLDEGHIVGSHGYKHDRATLLSRAAWKAEVKQSFLTLAKWYKLAGHEFTKHYYRFPFGDYGLKMGYHHINVLKEVSQELMGDNCIQMVFWEVDTADWIPGMTGEEVAHNIKAYNEGGSVLDFKKQGSKYIKVKRELKEVPAGGVVLQHDVHDSTVAGMDIILKYVQESGIKLLPLDEVDEFKILKKCSL